MKLRVHMTSGPSHQLYHDGKPCDRYVGTVYFHGGTYGQGWMRFTMTVVGNTAEQVDKKLNKYHWGDILEINEADLDPIPVIKKGGNNANTNR